MNIEAKNKNIVCIIDEMVEDVNSGFHSNETCVIGSGEGIQVQLTVTTDEDDFIESDHCHKTTTFSLVDSE